MNLGIIIVVAVIGLWALGIFMGAIGGFTKSFKNNSPAIDSSSVKDQEQKSIDDTEAKRQKLMDDMKQKIDDMKH